MRERRKEKDREGKRQSKTDQETLIEMEQDIQSSISYAGGTKLLDIRRVNYVILGGDNAGEHLLM